MMHWLLRFAMLGLVFGAGLVGLIPGMLAAVAAITAYFVGILDTHEDTDDHGSLGV